MPTSRENKPWDRSPKTPSLVLPPGATDCHLHIIGPFDRWPVAETARYQPADEATATDYDRLMQTLGLSRAVFVQTGAHGKTQQPTLEFVASDPDRFRAIAILDDSVTDAELEKLDAAGFRGVRFILNVDHPGAPDIDRRLMDRIAKLGWHLQLYGDASVIAARADDLRDLPVHVVFDHMGKPDLTAGGPEHPDFQAVLNLLGEGKFWVKVSGPMRFSEEDGHPWSDATPFAEALIQRAPDRCVWGTDWPHVNYGERMPNDGDIVDLLGVWCPDADVRTRILVGNPEQLYGFPPVD